MGKNPYHISPQWWYETKNNKHLSTRSIFYCIETDVLVKVCSTFMINILYILFRPYGPIMLTIPLITIVLMLATKIRNYRDNFIVYPELPFVQPPKNLESSRLNLFVLIIIFVNITGHQFYSWRQVKFILIIIYFN